MRRLLEDLIDPYAPALGPPPGTAWAFMRWMLAGAGPAIWAFGTVSVLLGFAEAFSAWAVGWVVDGAATADPARFLADHWLVLAAIAGFFLLLRPFLMTLASGLLAVTLNPGLFPLGIWRLHGHTLGQSLKFFEDDFAGRISQKEMQTSNSLNSVVNETLNAVAYGLAAIAGAMVVLASADWRLGLGLALWFAVYLVLVSLYLPRIRAASRGRADARSRVSGQLVDQISHMETVKLFAHSGREVAAAKGALGHYRDKALIFGRTVWVFRVWLAVLSGTLPVLLIGLALWLWQTGGASPGVIAMAGLLSTRLSQMSGWISFTAMAIFTDLGVIEDGMKTLARPHGMADRDDAASPEWVDGRIAFEDVVFRYGRAKGGGLHGVSLTVEPGEKVALVGASGAGKSTLLALLTRLYDVEEGRVTLDGRDIRDLAQEALRRQIAMVTQDTALFNRPALDNILYGRPHAGRDAAVEAARRASAHDFIEGLRDPAGRTGYDAHLGERGVRLSGGQRQRIAIARAILKDAPVLLLDEATSALDSEVEAAIQAELARLMAGKTVIAIAHRLSTLRAMDRIVVLEEGLIAEEGDHAGLLARDGIYARFWQRQAGGMLGREAAE